MSQEFRDSARFDHEAAILIENFPSGSYHHAKMFNYSAGGMYFESNVPFKHGTTIIFGIENSPFENCPGVYRAKVKWCKKLPDKSSIYYYGIGVEFFRPNRLASRVFRKTLPKGNYRADSRAYTKISNNDTTSTGSTNRNKAKYSRKHPRKPLSKNIHYTVNKQFYEGLVKDISRGGMFIKSHEKFPIGQELTLAIPSANRLKGLKLRGKVVRRNKEGIGVKFKTILKG